MSRIDLDNNQIMEYELLTKSGERIQEPYLLIYLALKGSLSVRLSEAVLELTENNFLLVNPFQLHSVRLNDSSLVMMFAVNLNVISGYYESSKMDFVGNSMDETSERCMSLHNLLEKCVAYYYGKRSGDGRIFMKLNSLYYQIAELLVASFSVIKSHPAENDEWYDGEDLVREMTRYIHMNFHSVLHLEDLAEQFYLSPTYVSRYFKKKLGVNFAKYLTGVRLEQAVKDLESTDKPLTRIALDCGFPNLAAFNKAFKENYGVNPKQYRNSLYDRKTEATLPEETENAVEIRLLDYFDDNEKLLRQEHMQEIQVEQLNVSANQYEVLDKTWNRMINIGGFSLLLQREIQNHLLFLCKELGFEYVRVWDLYAPELHVNIASKTRKYNFSNLDICLDFLTENHLIPYIELGFKPFLLLKNNYKTYDVNNERMIPFETAKDYGAFIKRLMKHLVNRYGIQELSKWIFEVWCDPRWFPDGDAAVYIEYFEAVYQNIKAVSPRTRVGGDYDRAYGKILFDTFIKQWSVRSILPDFVSLYCYPMIYMEPELEMEYSDGQIKGVDAIGEYVGRQKEILSKYEMHMPVYISEWNFTVINANVLNDSRFKGAYLMKTIMDIYHEVHLMGYWFGTDLFADDDDTPLLLNGRCGLITHQRICKPSFWAMSFLNRLEEYLVGKTDHAMVTMNEFGSYVIACHNYEALGIQYFVQQEKDVTVESIPHLYEKQRRRILKITITGVENGLYHVKTRFVNSQYGSVQDEWRRMGQFSSFTPADVEYINHISRPRIQLAEQTVTNNVLNITVEMEPQEIQLLHIFRHYDENGEEEFI